MLPLLRLGAIRDEGLLEVLLGRMELGMGLLGFFVTQMGFGALVGLGVPSWAAAQSGATAAYSRAVAEAAPGLAVLPFSVQGSGLEEWREGMTKEMLIAELTSKLSNVPGYVPGFLQPIENRILMISTGIRAQVGIKLLGENLEPYPDTTAIAGPAWTVAWTPSAMLSCDSSWTSSISE